MPVLPGDMCKITTGFLDTVNDVGVASLVAGDISERSGQLGQRFEFTNAQARSHSSTPSAARLYSGIYQYVLATSNLTRGQIVSWGTLANTGWTDFEVHAAAATADDALLAGIALGTVTSGRYCFIQTSGLAWVAFRSSVTNAAIGAGVYQVTTTATADAVADATAVINLGASGLMSYLGTAYALPVNSTVTQVMLRGFTANSG